MGVQRGRLPGLRGLAELGWDGWRDSRVDVGQQQDVRALPERADDRPRAEVAGVSAQEQERQEQIPARAGPGVPRRGAEVTRVELAARDHAGGCAVVAGRPVRVLPAEGDPTARAGVDSARRAGTVVVAVLTRVAPAGTILVRMAAAAVIAPVCTMLVRMAVAGRALVTLASARMMPVAMTATPAAAAPAPTLAAAASGRHSSRPAADLSPGPAQPRHRSLQSCQVRAFLSAR